MKWPRLLLLAGAIALAAWAWMLLHPSAESIIRKRLDGLARAASFGQNQGYLAKAAGAEKLISYFATNVDVQVDIPGLHEHTLANAEEIEQSALASRAAAKSVSVAFPDVTIIVNAKDQSAVADVTLQAQVAGEADVIVQEL
ncbi:MAG TPA: hypothetical protein VGO59_12260, partial [Verrucomicrobiae bacterium]